MFVPYSKSYLLGLLRSSGHVENQEALSDGYHIVAYVSPYMSEKLRLQQFTDLSSLKEHDFEYSASNLKTWNLSYYGDKLDQKRILIVEDDLVSS